MENNILNENLEEIKDYAQNASWYHTIKISDEITTAGVYDIDKYLAQYGFPDSLEGKDVLDVGCADGYFSFLFEKLKSKSVLAVDTNKFDGGTAIQPSLSRIKHYERKYKKAHEANQKFISLANKLGLDRVCHVLMLKKILGSEIQYKDFSVYDLSKLERKFNFVFLRRFN